MNRIEVVPRASPIDVRREIVRALHRDADVNARGIEVTATGEKVRLTGTVTSFREREAVELAASHSADITVLDNRLGVRLDEGTETDADDLG